LFPSSMSNLVTLISCHSMILLTMFSFLSIVKNVLPLTSFPFVLTFQDTQHHAYLLDFRNTTSLFMSPYHSMTCTLSKQQYV
jgi:hypothetical protein